MTAAASYCPLLSLHCHRDAPLQHLLQLILFPVFHDHIIANFLSSFQVKLYFGTAPQMSQMGNGNNGNQAAFGQILGSPVIFRIWQVNKRDFSWSNITRH